MNSRNNLILENERIIYKAKHHWGVLLGPLLVLFLAWLLIGSKGINATLLFAVALIWGIFSYISLHRSEIVLTDNRLLIDVGFPFKRIFNIQLNDVIMVDFYQPSLGAILDFGKIILVYNKNQKRVFRFFKSPADLVQEIQKQVIAVRAANIKSAPKKNIKRGR